MSSFELFEERRSPSPAPSPLLLPLECPTPEMSPFHVDFEKNQIDPVETINPSLLTIPKETIEMMYTSLIDEKFKCLCGIERKSKIGIRSHIKKVHFGQPKIKKEKIQKPKIKKEKIKMNCYNCNKMFASKDGVLRHIKKQVCAKDSDIVMGF